MVPEIGQFIRRHLWQLLLLVPGALLVTATHEAAHAVAVVLQGGTVREFRWLPTWSNWGSVSYQFPAGVEHSGVIVSLAPYGGWLLLTAWVCRPT